jgi:hypothetical protein
MEANLGVTREEKNEHRPPGPPMDHMNDVIGGLGDPDEVVYPHFHYCGPLDLELPDACELLVKVVKREETSYVGKDGKHWYECKIEVRTINKVDGEEPEAHIPARSYDAASDALDKIARELSKKHENDEGGEDKEEGAY